MAVGQIGNQLGIPACDIGGAGKPSNFNGVAGTDMSAALDIDNADTITALRTRLAAIDAGFYTAQRLNVMTLNDMIYAVRVNDNATTIKQ